MSNALKIWHWTPRIICILAILFVSLFALDAFEGDLTFGQKIVGLLIHLIPSFILLGLLLIAWKWENIGGLIFIVVGIVFCILLFKQNYKVNQSFWISLSIIATIPFPFLIAGILFLISHKKKKSVSKT